MAMAWTGTRKETLLGLPGSWNYTCKHMGKDIAEVSAQFIRERHAIMAFIYGLTRDASLAEDILQEVWLKLFESCTQKKDHIDNQLAWCRGTAKNIVLHHWRSRRNAKVVMDSELVDLIEQAFAEYDQGEDLVAHRQNALRSCMEGIPEESKKLLRLRYEEGRSFQQMSERLQRSANGLMMSLSRLRKSLLECIERRLHRQGETA